MIKEQPTIVSHPQNKPKIDPPRKTKRLNTDNTSNFIEKDINVDDRIIHIFEDIDASTASKVIKGIQLMVLKSKEKPIHIYINTTGGCAYSSFGIYNYIRSQHDVEIYTYVVGCAMSGGSIIFMAGDKRFMYNNSVLMIHSISSMASGNVFLGLESETEECKRIFKEMCIMYTKHSGPTYNYKYWYRTIKFQDKYYRYEEAKKIGLVDELVE